MLAFVLHVYIQIYKNIYTCRFIYTYVLYVIFYILYIIFLWAKGYIKNSSELLYQREELELIVQKNPYN